MQLYVEELKKTLRCKSTWLVMIAILAIQIVTVISCYKDLERKCGNVAEFNAYANQYNGTLIMEMVDMNDVQEMKNNSYQRQGNTKEDLFYERYIAAISRSIDYKEQYNDGKEPKYWNSIGINNLIQNLTTSVSAVFVFIGLLFGLYPIFLKDIENGMDMIIYSSYYGRKQILKAKCIAGIIFEVLWITIYYFGIAFYTILIFGNAEGLGIPINYIACLSLCTLPIKVWQYLLIGYLLLLIASTFITACFLLIYAEVKKIIIGVGVGIMVIFMPMFIPKNGSVGKFFCILPTVFSNTSLIVGENLKLNCLGTEIPVWGLGSVILPIGTILIFGILKKNFWNGRVEL